MIFINVAIGAVTAYHLDSVAEKTLPVGKGFIVAVHLSIKILQVHGKPFIKKVVNS